MKKFFPVFLAFLLVFSTVGPLPGVAAGFPGAVTYDVATGDDNKGTIMVTMDSGNSSWKITLHKKDTGARVGEPLGNNPSFTDVTPGLYEVRAEKIDSDPTITEISPVITVKPRPILVGSDVKTEPYKIIINNVIPGSKVNLYKSDSQTPYKTLTPNVANMVTFDEIDANRYSVTHLINGANSVHSGDIIVNPAAVKLDFVKDSGATNNLGELRVSGTKNGNELILYRSEQLNGPFVEDQRMVSKGKTDNFIKLKAGFYQVKQKENELESEFSNSVEIANERKPIIELIGPPIVELFHNEEGQNKYAEHGYKVIDKNGKSETLKIPLSCTSDNNLNISVSMMYKDRVITADQEPAPGIYTLIYTAEDCSNKKLFSTATRQIIVYPQKIKVNKTVNTLEYHGNSPIEQHQFGSITVENVFNNADLYLYQDPTETDDLNKAKEVSKIEKLNENTYTFEKVPVGKGYFVFQEVNGVKSKFSDRIEIKDTTPPEIILNTKDGAKDLDLEVGDTFIDPGFTAFDNIGIAEKVVTYDPRPVNTNQPGEYTIFYNAKDTAGLSAITKTRIVRVTPKQVIAIGSTAAVGEIGVTNIFPSTQNNKTILKLYKANSEGVFPENLESFLRKDELDAGQTTYVFKNLEPGIYLVRQEVTSQISRQSNVVEIIDIDKPVITLIGPENINVTMDSELEPYFASNNQFNDPGITAEDYLSIEPNSLTLTSTLISMNVTGVLNTGPGFSIKHPVFCITAPGTYKIKYTAKAKRGAEALPKYRTITAAPQKLNKPISDKSTVSTVTNSYTIPANTILITTVKLFNSYNQLMDTKSVTAGSTATFVDVPAGIGYYVTQTVNGIESQPSLPVNVSIFEDAKSNAMITSFGFSGVSAFSMIDQKTGEITVTVPSSTVLTNLIPVIEKIGIITPNTQRDFTNPVNFVVKSIDGEKSKTYTVKVKRSANSSIENNPLEKEVVLTSLSPSVSLSSAETEAARNNGVTFITKDKSIEAHIPKGNVIESSNSTFALKQTAAAYEISWGGLTRFMQPVELKLSKSGTKVLAKLVDGHTVAVPSTTASTTTTGLVNEPGTYALVDSVGAPRISPSTTGSETYKLQLALFETAGTIYYTTSSKDISFTSSALSNDAKLKNQYVATASPADILKWTKYTSDSKITTPTGELYAVAVNGNQISQITALEATPAVDWSKNIPSYETHKVLNINFNARVDRQALYSGLIYVTDDTIGQKVATSLQLSGDGKTIYVIPQQAYTRGKQYTLHIDRQFKGNTKNKEFLKKSLLQTFQIK